ncbi:hypothetical protein BDD12DRAFT_840884 [Trichophaea hybrida]|nr:hypothetical protein BDD12DRAFT_840884 [Trichophaea hybrida]
MEHKELDLLGTMLKGIVGIKPPHAQKPTEDQYRFYSTVLVQIQDDLAIFKIPLDSHPSIQFFFQTMVLKHFLAPLGPALDAKSAPTKNFSLPGLDCGTSKCDSCHKISSFLVSKNDTSETWTMTKAVRKHIHDALKDRYSHPKNVSVSETQPSGRIGTLTAKKVGMSLANRRKNWEKHRAIIELCLLKIQDSLGEGELRDLIVDAVKKGGLGYSTQLKTMANNLFAQKFPVSTAAASPSQTAHKRQRSVSEISSNSKLESTEMGPPKKRPYTVIDLCDISDEE